MKKIFTPADDKELDGMLRSARKRWHGALDEVEVTIACLFVHGVGREGEVLDETVLKHHGYAAAAVIKVNSYKDRVEGKADATLTLDEHAWGKLPKESRMALLDHELMHLEVIRHKLGGVVRDDCGRPVLKIHLHDFQIGGFDTVAKRHRDAALEFQHVGETLKRWRQLELTFE